jgi:hypothetical protein
VRAALEPFGGNLIMHDVNHARHLAAAPLLIAFSLLLGTAACSSGTEEGTPEETGSASAAIILTPCSSVANIDDGWYCGHSHENGFNSSLANPNWLYNCENHTVTGTIHCTNGCFVADSGSPDFCL